LLCLMQIYKKRGSTHLDSNLLRLQQYYKQIVFRLHCYFLHAAVVTLDFLEQVKERGPADKFFP
jgi:hypothetical protein